MTRYQIEAMERWSYPDSKGGRKANPFRAKYADTLDLLGRELDHLDVVGAVAVRVVTREADIRRDGMLRAQAKVLHPGVALSFRSSSLGDLTYPCDRFEARYYGEVGWQVNLRAVAVQRAQVLQAERDRSGPPRPPRRTPATSPPRSRATPRTARPARRCRLREVAGWASETSVAVGPLLRRAAAVAHPDRNDGDRTLWDRVDAARQLLEGSR